MALSTFGFIDLSKLNLVRWIFCLGEFPNVRNRSNLGRSFTVLMLLLGACAAVPQASANTYQFTFTTSQILSALQTSLGSTNYNEDAFYAIFLQPTGFTTIGGDNTVTSNPDSTGADAWTTNANFTDPSDSNFGSSDWVQFSKSNGQTTVSVVSANTGNLFWSSGCSATSTGTCHQYDDSNSLGYPVSFGTTDAYITNIISTSATFSFTVQTTATLSGSYTIDGLAEAINNNTGNWSFGCCKTASDISFSLSGTPTLTAVPEPGPWLLVTVGMVLIGGSTWMRRFLRRRPS